MFRFHRVSLNALALRSMLAVSTLAIAMALASTASAAHHESDGTPAAKPTEAKSVPAEAASVPAEAAPADSTLSVSGAEAAAPVENVVGGRDISAKRGPELVWTEMVQIRNKMDSIANDRDMRALVLTPQEQALFVAFSKRLYDLSKELRARANPQLDAVGKIKVQRATVQFQSSLGDLRTIAAGFIHREMPEELRKMTLKMKGLWIAFPEGEKLLGPEALPPVEELRYQYPK